MMTNLVSSGKFRPFLPPRLAGRDVPALLLVTAVVAVERVLEDAAAFSDFSDEVSVSELEAEVVSVEEVVVVEEDVVVVVGVVSIVESE
jgi:hypothetical protein